MDDQDSGASTGIVLAPNISEEQRDQYRAQNFMNGWGHMKPGPWFPYKAVVLVAGGPSLSNHLDQLHWFKDTGVPLITVNGAHKWCMDKGLWPSAQIVMDARESNKKFTHPRSPSTTYIIADDVHPAILEGLPKERVALWDRKALKGSGSTVVLCAMAILKNLGVEFVHVFGFDSCYIGDAHHAYKQTENDIEEVLSIVVDGKEFFLSHWMVQQAEEALELRESWGDIRVYGDGLIATLFKDEEDEDLAVVE